MAHRANSSTNFMKTTLHRNIPITCQYLWSNTKTKSNFGGKGFVSLNIIFHRRRKSGEELRSEPGGGRKGGVLLNACSTHYALLPSLRVAPPAMGWRLPHQTLPKTMMPHRLLYRLNSERNFLSWRRLPGDSSLGCVNQTLTHIKLEALRPQQQDQRGQYLQAVEFGPTQWASSLT